MCKEPYRMPNGTEVACRKCEQCCQRKINDWVGRNIAESKVSKTVAVTLTYGRNEANEEIHERTVSLTYSDFQKYIKLLRRHGYPVRYLVAGEYGSLNGRAHWHAILHFEDRVPDHENQQNFMHEIQSADGNIVKLWPHGWSFWDSKPDMSAVRYICKYVLKDSNDELKQAHLSMSKKPPIGARYFEQVADDLVKAGLAPQQLEYSFPDVQFTKKDGTRERVRFFLSGRSAELYLDHYIKRWAEVHTNRPMPRSELLELYREYGQIVRDEQALIIKRQFPKGESVASWPTTNDLIELGAEARRRKVIQEFKGQIFDVARWWATWIGDAHGQERQKRKERYKLEFDTHIAKTRARYIETAKERWPNICWDFLSEIEFDFKADHEP